MKNNKTITYTKYTNEDLQRQIIHSSEDDVHNVDTEDRTKTKEEDKNILENTHKEEDKEKKDLSEERKVNNEVNEKENDEFLEEEVYRNDSSGLIEQDDGIVEWHIENIFSEEGKRYNRRELKSNPPLLVIKDNYGDEATFILTEKLALHLRDSMNLVYNAYYNVETKGYNEDSTKWWMRKTLPLIVIAVLLAISIILSFF